MSAMDIALDAVKIDEGLRLTPYICTEGKLTIGYGRNLDSIGITEEEANAMLLTDLVRAEADARVFVGAVWPELSDVRQAVLINMSLNLGLTRLSKFIRFRASLQSQDWTAAAAEMLDSRWANQVGRRAMRLAEEMREG